MHDEKAAGRRSSESEGDSRADSAIDEAARHLTRGEPSPRLRQQVRARIETPRGWSLPVWVPALGGVAALVTFAALIQLSGAPVSLPTAPSIAHGPTAAPLVVEQPLERERSERPERPERPERSERPKRSAIQINPLVIEPIAMPLMAVTTSSGEMPIEIDDLRVEPLQIE